MVFQFHLLLLLLSLRLLSFSFSRHISCKSKINLRALPQACPFYLICTSESCVCLKTVKSHWWEGKNDQCTSLKVTMLKVTSQNNSSWNVMKQQQACLSFAISLLFGIIYWLCRVISLNDFNMSHIIHCCRNVDSIENGNCSYMMLANPTCYIPLCQKSRHIKSYLCMAFTTQFRILCICTLHLRLLTWFIAFYFRVSNFLWGHAGQSLLLPNQQERRQKTFRSLSCMSLIHVPIQNAQVLFQLFQWLWLNNMQLKLSINRQWQP